MTTATATAAAAAQQRQWFIVGRWEEFEGEAQANLLRIIAVGAFYIVELLRFHIFEKGAADHMAFHRQATMIAVAWSMVSLAVLLCLRMRFVPSALKYVSTACDVGLLTALAAVAGGPLSAMVLVYFLILSLAALRFSLGLVWFTTLASMAGYESLVGSVDKKWFDAEHAVPPATQLVTLLSLAMTGVVIGQVVRRVKTMAEEYARRMTTAGKAA